MVAADHDRRLQLACGDEPVELEAGLRPLAVAQPADPRGKTLERNLLLGHRDPTVETLVLGEQIEDRSIRSRDVRRVAAQGGPSERPATLAEERSDERRNEPRVVERVGDAGL